MKLLVLGGTGILSTAVVNEALNLGFEVTMINRGNNRNLINPLAKLIKGDIRNNPEGIRDSLLGERFDAVIDFLIWNIEQLKLSLSLFSDIASQYIFISSAQAYNTSINGLLTEESELVQPLWKYSVNKVKSEQYLMNFCKEKPLKYTIIRPGVTYGDTRIPYGMYPKMGMHWTIVERIKAGKPIVTWNNGNNRLNLTRSEDFAKGAVGLVGNSLAFNQIFNVVGDNIYSWKEVLLTLGRIINKEVIMLDVPVDFYAKYLYGDKKEMLIGGRATDLICSNMKLKQAVPSFKTNYSLEEGLQKTIEAYKYNNYFKGIDYEYDALLDRITHDYIKLKPQNMSINIGFIPYMNTNLKERIISAKQYYFTYYKTSLTLRSAKHKVKDLLKSK